MKKNQFLGAALALIVVGHSCKNDDYRDLGTNDNAQVQFTSSIAGSVATRVTGNAWDADDAVGVFMKQGDGLSNPLAANKKYSTGGNGNFSGQGADIINYPQTGSVDFIAYYPYTTNLEGAILPVTVADQSAPAAIDVLYSNNATGLTKASGAANLTFNHKLTKVALAVKPGNGLTDVNGLQVVYRNVNTTAALDLATGILSGAAAVQNVTAKTTAQTDAQLVEAILLPGDFSAKELVFTLASGTFKWTLPANTTFEEGKKYTYDIVLLKNDGGNQAAVTGNGTITDWTTVPGGSVNVDIDGSQTPTDPGKEETLFLETFGDPDPKASKKDRIGTYAGYTATGVTYSDLYTATYADVRATSTINGHVWLPANKDTGFKIEGINAAGVTNLKLSYKLAGNAVSLPMTGVKVRVNGVELAVPTGVLGAEANTFSTIDISGIANSNSITLEFYSKETDNTNGYRIDDIKLVGTK